MGGRLEINMTGRLSAVNEDLQDEHGAARGVDTPRDDRPYLPQREVSSVPRQSMREEIVEAALERFHAHGFNAAGVKDITDTAGVPKGSFYNHFDSKEALALVALERYGESLRMRMLTDTGVEPLA